MHRRPFPFPPPDAPDLQQSYACWQNAFNAKQCAAIRELGNSLPPQPGRIFAEGAGDVVEATRRSTVSWIHNTPETAWIYEMVMRYALDLNQYFRFDLYGFVDSLQYSRYEGSKAQPGHYHWHMDMGLTFAPRKLSVAIPLSEPDDYEGGDLEFLGISTGIAPRHRGHMHAFPSWVLHRVAPVTAGVRCSLVGWIAGPMFR